MTAASSRWHRTKTRTTRIRRFSTRSEPSSGSSRRTACEAAFSCSSRGESRARAVAYVDDGEAMLRATLVPMERHGLPDPADPSVTALDSELRERAAELGTRRGVSAEALNQLIQGVDDPGSFADLVAFYLDLPTDEKQELLETLGDEDRMRAALVAVERELVRIDAQEDIQAKVQEELGERQREMLLREQMKQIRKELGEEGDRDDVEELRDRIAKLELTEVARNEVERELRRLDRTSPAGGRVPGDPDLPGVDHRTAVERTGRTTRSTCIGRRRSSTRTTTAWKT